MDDFLGEDSPQASYLNDMDDLLNEDFPRASYLNDMDDFLNENSPKASYLNDMNDFLSYAPDALDYSKSEDSNQIPLSPSPSSEQAPSHGSQYIDDLDLHGGSSAIPEENLALNAVAE